MTTAGRDSRSTITVVNTGATTLPVEVNVSRLDLGENGELGLTPDDEDFLVFPPQAMLAPGASQVFRLQWAGEPDLGASRSYALMVNQIPVDSQNGGTVLELVYSVVVYVNVSPLQGDADLRLVRVALITDEHGAHKLELVVENRGNRHHYLSRDRILLKDTASGWSRDFRASECLIRRDRPRPAGQDSKVHSAGRAACRSCSPQRRDHGRRRTLTFMPWRRPQSRLHSRCCWRRCSRFCRRSRSSRTSLRQRRRRGSGTPGGGGSAAA
ncbi:MAG: fimbria/pilus periplasmic chaperone [Rhodospirillales bacterium]